MKLSASNWGEKSSHARWGSHARVAIGFLLGCIFTCVMLSSERVRHALDGYLVVTTFEFGGDVTVSILRELDGIYFGYSRGPGWNEGPFFLDMWPRTEPTPQFESNIVHDGNAKFVVITLKSSNEVLFVVDLGSDHSVRIINVRHGDLADDPRRIMLQSLIQNLDDNGKTQ
jgi:hypothetical protein